jgi:hypothetical protein
MLNTPSTLERQVIRGQTESPTVSFSHALPLNQEHINLLQANEMPDTNQGSGTAEAKEVLLPFPKDEHFAPLAESKEAEHRAKEAEYRARVSRGGPGLWGMPKEDRGAATSKGGQSNE